MTESGYRGYCNPLFYAQFTLSVIVQCVPCDCKVDGLKLRGLLIFAAKKVKYKYSEVYRTFGKNHHGFCKGLLVFSLLCWFFGF